MSDPGNPKPVRTFRMTPLRRVGNGIIRPLIRLGIAPSTYVLTVRGRKSGQPRSTPVTLVERDGQRWLVAPYGPVDWVWNVRAAGRVQLSRRGRTEECTTREVTPAEAGPVLKRYLAMARPTRPYFRAGPGDPPETFAAEAALHPVFELTG